MMSEKIRIRPSGNEVWFEISDGTKTRRLVLEPAIARTIASILRTAADFADKEVTHDFDMEFVEGPPDAEYSIADYQRAGYMTPPDFILDLWNKPPDQEPTP